MGYIYVDHDYGISNKKSDLITSATGPRDLGARKSYNR